MRHCGAWDPEEPSSEVLETAKQVACSNWSFPFLWRVLKGKIAFPLSCLLLSKPNSSSLVTTQAVLADIVLLKSCLCNNRFTTDLFSGNIPVCCWLRVSADQRGKGPPGFGCREAAQGSLLLLPPPIVCSGTVITFCTGHWVLAVKSQGSFCSCPFLKIQF